MDKKNQSSVPTPIIDSLVIGRQDPTKFIASRSEIPGMAQTIPGTAEPGTPPANAAAAPAPATALVVSPAVEKVEQKVGEAVVALEELASLGGMPRENESLEEYGKRIEGMGMRVEVETRPRVYQTRMPFNGLSDLLEHGYSIWTGSSGGADMIGGTDYVLWNNLAGSDPVSVIRREVFQLTLLGIDPMDLKLVLGPLVFQVLLDHPKFLERFEQVQVSVMNEQLMAQVLGIGEVMVAYGSYLSLIHI
jgi:hypothetical protein